jgi:hypothetical protein
MPNPMTKILLVLLTFAMTTGAALANSNAAIFAC